MKQHLIRVHVLFESSANGNPHGCSEIRLLRPLSHPSLQSYIDLTFGLEIPDYPIDVVIIERYWNYAADQNQRDILLKKIRHLRIPMIFEMDDDLLSLSADEGNQYFPTSMHQMWIRSVIRAANQVIVSTPALGFRIAHLNTKIVTVANALDERLFEPFRTLPPSRADRGSLVFGYMGTHTHLQDLLSIIEPLRRTLYRHRNEIKFEIVGIGNPIHLQQAFDGLPVEFLSVPASSVGYKDFTVWMREELQWDFGLAPLIDSAINRSKSDIKFLDYAVQGIPAIFSDVPAYQNTVTHLQTGLLASTSEDWEACLEQMIANGGLRASISAKAHQYVWNNRMLETKARDWHQVIHKVSLHRVPNTDEIFNHRFRPNIQPIVQGTNLTRNDKILHGLRRQGFGLEIGPSFSPVVSKKEGYRVEVLDHADAATLRNKYQNQNVDISRIEEVDHVWSGQPLHELTGKINHYDWIIASHVIEHTPDLISFLQQCEAMLIDDGVLSLAVPDHRYCFDRFRPPSTPGDVIQAHLDRRSRHTPGIVWDHFSMIFMKGDVVSWQHGHEGTYQAINSLDDAVKMLNKAQTTDEYLDVHNWRFTPSTFLLIIEDLRLLSYINIQVKNIFSTVGCEFFVQLQKSADRAGKYIDMEARLQYLENALNESHLAD